MKREVRLFDEIDRFAGSGHVTHAMALSYGYDGDVANERVWRPLIERFGVRHPLVIADGEVTQAGTSLAVHVLRARRVGGVFHPKLFLAVREDAAFVAVGSANLTRGGLGANLELMTPLVFGREVEGSAPRKILLEVVDFLRRHVIEGLSQRVAPSSVEVARDLVRHAELVADALPDRARNPDLTFLHSYETPIWTQFRHFHGEDAIERLVVVSPFLEQDDPAADDTDSLIRYALSGGGISWSRVAAAPRCSLYAGASDCRLALPVTALRELSAEVEVHLQKLSFEPRRLHGKLLIAVGKKRTTVLWGSPNFTPAALLRSVSERGNVECALVASFDTKSGNSEALQHDLDLKETFEPVRGALPDPIESAPRVAPVFEVGEALYDPATRQLKVYVEIFDARVRTVRIEGVGAEMGVLVEAAVGASNLLTLAVIGDGLEQIDPATGKRQLRTLMLCAIGLDEASSELGRLEFRINVRFDDALEVRQNLLLGPGVLSADALLVPSTAPPEQRVAAVDAQIAAWKAAREGNAFALAQHQPSLDVFFRNVRKGLDARWVGLSARRGSRFALLHWSGAIRRALGAAVPPDGLGVAQRLYLTVRVATHIGRVLEAIPGWHEVPIVAFAALEPHKLAEALDAIPLPPSEAHGDTTALVDAARHQVVQQLRALA